MKYKVSGTNYVRFLVLHVVLCIPAGFRDVLAFSHLKVVRMALWHVGQALLLWFASSPPPSVNAVGRILGVSGSSNGPLHEILHCALRHEARWALHQHQQQNTTLHDFIEADGTSVCHFRMGTDLVYDQWYGMVQRAAENQRSRKIVLFPLGHAGAKALGKPPPESYSKIKAAGAFSFVVKNPSQMVCVRCC